MAHSNRPPLSAEQSLRDAALKQAARDATLKVGPRVYRITGIPDAPIKIIALGCQGEGNDAQRETAKLMNTAVSEMIARGETPPVLAIYAGDNLYNRGTSDPLDGKFNTHHKNIYYDPLLPAINPLPSIVTIGNHDENYDEIAKIPASLNMVSQGEVVGINQTAHHYLDNSQDSEDIDATLLEREKMIEARTQLFMQAEIHISQLGKWVMPYYFYSLILGNTQIFILNSNDLPKHFLLSVTKQTKDGFNFHDGPADAKRVNQFEWFLKEYQAAIAADRQIFIVEHIPQVVCGKRSFRKKFDATHFLTSNEIRDMNTQLKHLNPDHVYTESYNDLKVCIYRQFNISPHLFICAHEHFLSWLNQYKLADGTLMAPQFTAGGGGGKLQHRESFRNHPFVGMQQSHHGFGIIECNMGNSKSFKLDVFTIEGLRMRFTEKSYKPVIEIMPEDTRPLHLAVQEACDEFLVRLKDKELHTPAEGTSSYLAWTFGAMAYVASSAVEFYKDDPEERKRNHEIEHLHDLSAYFNQRNLPDFTTALKRLHEITEQLPHHKSAHLPFPLYVILENKIRERLHKPLNELYEDAGIVKCHSLTL